MKIYKKHIYRVIGWCQTNIENKSFDPYKTEGVGWRIEFDDPKPEDTGFEFRLVIDDPKLYTFAALKFGR